MLLKHSSSPGGLDGVRRSFLCARPFRPLHGDVVVVSVGVDPVLVVARALAERFLAHQRQTHNLTDEVDNLLRPRQPAEIALDYDAVEAMVDKEQQIFPNLGELFHAAALYSFNKAASTMGGWVSIGQRFLFSADTGDAWLLDGSDQLAAPLARDGTRNRFLYRRPTAASPSDGKATIALKDPIERSNPI